MLTKCVNNLCSPFELLVYCPSLDLFIFHNYQKRVGALRYGSDEGKSELIRKKGIMPTVQMKKSRSMSVKVASRLRLQ